MAPVVVSPTGELEGSISPLTICKLIIADPYDPLRPNTAPIPTPPPAINRLASRVEVHKGPNHDKTNTTLVIESIPHGLFLYFSTYIDKMNEESIKEWFSQFGTLNQITLDKSRNSAILVYADWESAFSAWNDPRPVFSNRFVKIFWKKSDNEKGVVDPSELEAAREAAKKAQKEHEEKQRRKAELEKKREELEKQRLGLVERQRVERERLLEKIKKAQEKAKDKARGVFNSATKHHGTSPPQNDVNGGRSNGDKKEEEGEPSRKAKLQSLLSDLRNQVLHQ